MSVVDEHQAVEALAYVADPELAERRAWLAEHHPELAARLDAAAAALLDQAATRVPRGDFYVTDAAYPPERWIATTTPAAPKSHWVRELYERMRARGDLAVLSTGWHWSPAPAAIGPRRHFVLDRPASLLPDGAEQTRKADPGHE